MQQKHTIGLKISLPDGGSSTRDVIELYSAQIRDDIEQTAWNLCDCDDQVQKEKFSNLVLDRWSVTHKQGDDFHIKALFAVNAMSVDFVKQVIDEYMDGFADYIADAINSYYSRTGKRVSINPHPFTREVEVN